jgi:hypothetical protein
MAKLSTIFGSKGECKGCRLTSVFIPNTFTAIANNAFRGSEVMELSIPASITAIKVNAFKNAEVDQLMISDLESWCKIEFGNEDSNPCRYSTDNVFIGNQECTYVDIPNTITKLNPFVFSYWRNLKHVKLPNTITTIGKAAFYYCLDRG